MALIGEKRVYCRRGMIALALFFEAYLLRPSHIFQEIEDRCTILRLYVFSDFKS